MAKKARKKAKAAKRAKARRPAKTPARAKTARKPRPTKVASAFQIMIDTINETERMREEREARDPDKAE